MAFVKLEDVTLDYPVLENKVRKGQTPGQPTNAIGGQLAKG